MNESYLWKKINNLQKKQRLWHFTRIESATVRGIPDVNCVIDGKEFWLELKGIVGKNLGLSNYQINWHYKHYQCGGLVFILLPSAKERGFKLFRLLGLGSRDEDQESCNHNHIGNHIGNHIPNHIRNHNHNHIHDHNHIHNHNTRIVGHEPIFKLIISADTLEKLFIELCKKLNSASNFE